MGFSTAGLHQACVPRPVAEAGALSWPGGVCVWPAANTRRQITLQHVLKLYPMEAAGTVQDGNDLVSEHYDELVAWVCGGLWAPHGR
jgi:hypothetical protein